MKSYVANQIDPTVWQAELARTSTFCEPLPCSPHQPTHRAPSSPVCQRIETATSRPLFHFPPRFGGASTQAVARSIHQSTPGSESAYEVFSPPAAQQSRISPSQPHRTSRQGQAWSQPPPLVASICAANRWSWPPDTWPTVSPCVPSQRRCSCSYFPWKGTLLLQGTFAWGRSVA